MKRIAMLLLPLLACAPEPPPTEEELGSAVEILAERMFPTTPLDPPRGHPPTAVDLELPRAEDVAAASCEAPPGPIQVTHLPAASLQGSGDGGWFWTGAECRTVGRGTVLVGAAAADGVVALDSHDTFRDCEAAHAHCR